MSLLRLLLNSLAYFWRGNLAILLGVAVGCAVLTGALLVGDSLRGSLRTQSERRLGWVTHALTASRFFREALAAEVAEKANARVVPALLLRATVFAGEGAERREVRNVTILGVTDGFFDHSAPTLPAASSALARTLGVEDGGGVTVSLQKPSALPREAALASKEAEFKEWRLRAVQVLTPTDEGDTFNLRPELDAPQNLFVPLKALQEELGLSGEVNALLAAGDGAGLQAGLESELKIEDWGLVLRTPAQRADALIRRYDRNGNGKLERPEWWQSNKPRFAGVLAEAIGKKGVTLEGDEVRAAFERHYSYLTLESKQLLIPPVVAQAVPLAVEQGRLQAALTLVNLCRIQVGGKTVVGVVAALNPGHSPPLGPFLPPGVKSLKDDQIVLADYAAHWPLQDRPTAGAEVVLRFKPAESQGEAADLSATFRLAGYVEMKRAAADPSLTPEFPGITDKDATDQWKLPFEDEEWNKEKVRQQYTDAYWDRYRATPKAYITLKAGQGLWPSRFGDLTGVRIATGGGVEAEQRAAKFRSLLLLNLKPTDGGFVFDAVRATSLEASQGGTPFGLLFLGFSFFLIIAALLLVGLLYRLNLDRRAQQVGLLMAEGFPTATVRGLFLAEGGLLALLGVVVGSFLALIYSRLLIQLLAVLWPGGVLQSFLAPHAELTSFLIGIGSALVVSIATIAWVVRVLGRVPPRALLAGQSVDDIADTQPGVSWLSWLLLVAAVVIGAALLWLGPQWKGHMAKALTFFGSGALFLTAGLTAVYIWMRGTRQTSITGGFLAVARLGLRNAARHPMRSLLTVGLLASAAFLIVAVESFRRQAHAGDGDIHHSDGGFSLVAESHSPIVPDLNTPSGRDEILDRLETRLATLTAQERQQRLAQARDILENTQVVGLLARAGDDASCLNLYKPQAPRILGVPNRLIERGGFVFDAVEGRPENPWTVLQRGGEGKIVPAFGESNTVTYMLQTSLGGTVEVTDDRGQPRKLLIAGLMHDSVFQSSLLISEDEFKRLYPSQEAFPSYFLIAPPKGREEEAATVLTQALTDWGLVVERTEDRLAAYLAVENTYLSTFQALGGLGLLLGSLGVAVVLLRAIWERRAELALLRALGWTRPQVAWLVLAENLFLLLLGLVVGTVAAVLSVSPQLASGEGSIPWQNLALLFAGVLGTGVLACVLAVLGSLWAPIVPALRRE